MGRFLFYSPAVLITTLIVVVSQLSSLSYAGDVPVIEISTGKIKGDDKESREDKPYFAYRGIPYAAPPKNELRFLPPQPPANWSDVKETEDFKKECLHWDPYDKKVDGSEDCLYLNVYTPKFGEGLSKKLLPVIFYIGGGYFMSGSANHYKPHYFMDLECVVVSLNYRTGALGFLNVDHVVRGNMGLKDQLMALKWVQKNIRKFAGDPLRVTIIGDGNGASSVHYHLLSPLSKGLFQRAVSISGTAIGAYAFQPRPFQAARRLGKLLKCHETTPPTTNGTKKKSPALTVDSPAFLLNCLRGIEGKKLVEIEKETWSPLREPSSLFLPSVETLGGNYTDTFLSEHPYSLLVSGKQLRVPWIIGINSEEGLAVTSKILSNKELLETAENRWNDFSGDFLLYDKTRRDVTEKIRRFYIDPSILVPISAPATTTPFPQPHLPVGPTPPNVVISPGSVKVNHNSPPQLRGRNGSYTNIYPTLPGQPHSPIQTHPVGVTAVPIILPGNGTPSAAAVSTYKLESFENNVINFEEKLPNFNRLFTDRMFTAPLVEAARIQSKYSPVFIYYNKYKGQFSFSDVYAGKTKEPVPALKRVSSWFKTKVLGRTTQPPAHLGVCHGDMTPLLFKFHDAKVKENTKDYSMSKDLVNLFVRFASAFPTLEFRNVTWTPLDPSQNGTLNALQFSNNDKENVMLYDVFRDIGDFWESLKYLAPFQV